MAQDPGAGRGPLCDLLALPIKAFLFDLDGVVTRTAEVHARAWKQLFDGFLEARASGGRFTAFGRPEDCAAYVDGKPRYEGVRSFRDSRGSICPEAIRMIRRTRRPSAGSATARTACSPRSCAGTALRCSKARSR